LNEKIDGSILNQSGTNGLDCDGKDVYVSVAPARMVGGLGRGRRCCVRRE